jgi:RNA 2',3'-cyclic 3'-phosphodiesterase
MAFMPATPAQAVRVRLGQAASLGQLPVGQYFASIFASIFLVAVEPMRLFIAVNFPNDLRARWGADTAPLRSAAPALRWVSSAQMHLTVAFLGEQPETVVDGLRATLDAATTGRAPLSLEIQGIGAFPNWRRPRVVWLGIVPAPPLLALAEAVARGCRALGIPEEERPFHPHITLARIDGRVPPHRVRQLAEAARTVTDRSMGEVQSLDLMASTLGPGGAKHAVLYRALLAPGATRPRE